MASKSLRYSLSAFSFLRVKITGRIAISPRSSWATLIQRYFNENISQYEKSKYLNDTIEVLFHVDMKNQISALRVYMNRYKSTDSLIIKIARNCIKDLQNNESFLRSDSNYGTNQIHKLFVGEKLEKTKEFIELENELSKSGLSKKRKQELLEKLNHILLYE